LKFAYTRALSALFIATLAACAGNPTTSSLPSNTAAGNTAVTPSEVKSAPSLKFQVLTAGQTPGFPSGADAFDIAAGPNQTMWFTDDATPAIGRIASDGTITEFTTGLPAGATPTAIASGPDGNMWFADYRGAVIGKVTPNGKIMEYSPKKSFDTHAKGITFGIDGRPWIVAFGIDPVLAQLNANGSVTVQPLAKYFTPDGSLASDASGNIWFTGLDKHLNGQLLERVAATGKIQRKPMHMTMQFLPCCPNSAAKPMAIGPNGVPWFTTMQYLREDKKSLQLGTLANGKVKLVRLTHAGTNTGGGYASAIAFDGTNLWVAGNNPFQLTGSLWKYAAKGKQSVFAVPYSPLSLATDAAGHPWFTSHFGGQPSQIVEVLKSGSN
jgi:streptogramin lyase